MLFAGELGLLRSPWPPTAEVISASSASNSRSRIFKGVGWEAGRC
jgi:hypothetical protein